MIINSGVISTSGSSSSGGRFATPICLAFAINPGPIALPRPLSISGNPGGRPQGLARATRELVGEDGHKLAELWWDIATDETQRSSDRLEASKLLAERGWGKAAVFSPQEGDPLDLAALEGAAETFTARILKLAGEPEPDASPS